MCADLPDQAPASGDDQLDEAWRLLMGLVLQQRWRWSDVATELGLSQAGLRALLAVDPHRPGSMRDLARALGCDPSYVTAMVDDLERAGLALRQGSPDDRRVKTLVLTPAGRDALTRVQRDLFAPPARLTRLTGPQRRQLGRLLMAALQDAASPDPDTSAGRPRPS